MSDAWYYGKDGQTLGPVTGATLSAMFNRGEINQQTLVNREGMPGWQPMEKVPELKFVYYRAPPTCKGQWDHAPPPPHL